MQRVLIIGSGGSGKTTLARKLAAKTGLPLYYLDALYWQPGWREPPKAEWRQRMRTLVEEPTWIIEGNFSGTLDVRIPRATHIILLEIPPWQCLWNVLKRRFRYASRTGRSRPGMAAGCPEKLDFAFLRWIWRYPRETRPRVRALIRDFQKEGTEVLVFRSHRATEGFLRSRNWESGGRN